MDNKLFIVEIVSEDGTFFESVTGSHQYIKELADSWNNRPDKNYTATIFSAWSN